MSVEQIISKYKSTEKLKTLAEHIKEYSQLKVSVKGLKASSKAFFITALHHLSKKDKLLILSSREEAIYFKNDLESLVGKQKILFFPSPFKNDDPHLRLNPLTLERTNVLNSLKKPTSSGRILLTYPAAVAEKVVSVDDLSENTSRLSVESKFDIDFMIEFLNESGFEITDFVSEAGYFSVRGGIVDIFSFGHPLPYRIELLDDRIESIREFDPETQLSIRNMNQVSIIPDLEKKKKANNYLSLFEFISTETLVIFDQFSFIQEALNAHHTLVTKLYKADKNLHLPDPKKYYCKSENIADQLGLFSCIDLSNTPFYSPDEEIEFNTSPQPPFNKNFNMLAESMKKNQELQFDNFIFSESTVQVERIYEIFEDRNDEVRFTPVYANLHAGFTDKELKIACFTEHEIFNRYHKYKEDKTYSKNTALTLKDLYELKPGDYVTHINHGIGRFSGLQKIETQGRRQEAIRLEYKGGDLLYVNIHSLHKITRYIGQEGKIPKLHRLGSKSWEILKNKTKSRVKDIARGLIQLYAQRKAIEGYAFSPDTYLQTELEASFIYEDTPDQARSTADLKTDMERPYPMDRLICGDVGYGKTEIAIRAAFKAVADSKQVAILVPTTILAFQHYKTFSDRLKEFPCNIDYISRFKTTRKTTEIKKKLADGRIDIVIGTHKLLSKDVKFKDLGLLIIDEEQKFGVAAKEKLRSTKVNVDTLSLTATPIPRTLQFSLMGVRDLSIINTAPPNRQAIDTTLKVFEKATIQDAVKKELSRGGQVFFVHNRIKDLKDVADVVQTLVPYAKIAVAHGQMEGVDLEEIMLNFIDGYYDVLVSTNIIESGLDIPNANTIIINEAQNFGLSDLYQMRGRVGRSNIKAYCYLFVHSFTSITSDARKRLAAIEEFSELGSGLHVAMRDMDIRGAGNLLGAEQSGFISEIGLDMYKKILDEALTELRQEEFGDLFAEREDLSLFKECVIDTDMPALLPDEYVSSVEERLILYNKLNRILNEKELKQFEQELIDRFGPIPYQTNDLLDIIRLKWKSMEMGIEKITMKNKLMKVYFPYTHSKNQKFQSSIIQRLLTYAKQNSGKCQFNEKPKGLELIVKPIEFVDEALQVINSINSAEMTSHI
ncbi:MAG: transcription-repair coupling factor [Bacteroidetes bacterium]|nr:transcription-repair coupling factor [Bacteroidota bacterium]MBL6963290.1 transcription-repair coupling factor [Bacteroidota bacterium]